MNIGLASLITTWLVMLVALAWVFGFSLFATPIPNEPADPNGLTRPQP